MFNPLFVTDPIKIIFTNLRNRKAWMELPTFCPTVVAQEKCWLHHGFTKYPDVGLDDATLSAHAFPQVLATTY